MLDVFLEMIGSLGMLGCAVAHYRIAVTGRGQSPLEEPGRHGWARFKYSHKASSNS